MPPKKGSTSKDSMSASDLTATFLAVLDNDEVVTKLASILAASINLILDEKIAPLVAKLDSITSENKILHKRVADVELENAKLKQTNDSLHATLDNVTIKVNQLEQASQKNCVVISGVMETYAERTQEGGDDTSPAQPSREDTVNTVCSLLKTACNVEVLPVDILSAFRLRSKRTGPRPILVTFNSLQLRTAVIRSRRPKQQLKYNGTNIYINDHLTKANSDLAHAARQLVKQHDAHATWVRDGQIFIKWSATSRSDVVHSMSDLI
jgi:flagellar biosynthesis/type III secretory pathway chaperone